MFDTDENSHYNWGSYYVEYAESYDVSDGVNVTNETKPFVLDEQTNCSAFTGFLNPSFNDGLDDWDLIQLHQVGTDVDLYNRLLGDVGLDRC